jgi:hypothetical protein
LTELDVGGARINSIGFLSRTWRVLDCSISRISRRPKGRKASWSRRKIGPFYSYFSLSFLNYTNVSRDFFFIGYLKSEEERKFFFAQNINSNVQAAVFYQTEATSTCIPIITRTQRDIHALWHSFIHGVQVELL